ncbi:BamA/TamA family outer membrane protein [bacterium]|nr:BamA/TamA family outer membrane protein [bacterium]
MLLTDTEIAWAKPKEKKKFKVVKVQFEGNVHFEDDQLYKVMVSRPSTFFHKRYYHPSIYQDDLDYLVAYYQNAGFLQAEVSNHKVTIDSSNYTAKLEISVSEGKRTFVSGVRIAGNLAFSDAVILNRIPLKTGNPLEQEKFKKGVVNLVSLYADNGYLDASVDSERKLVEGENKAAVAYHITENNQSFISSIDYPGLEKTRPSIVRRELLFHPEEHINYSNLLKSQRKLYQTGLFKSVFIHPGDVVDSITWTRPVIIEVKEKPSREVTASIGYASIERARGMLELSSINLMGTARKATLLGKVSFIGYRGEAALTQPWTFGFPWRSKLSTLTEYRKEPGYKVNTNGVRANLKRSFFLNSSYTIGYRYERSNLHEVSVKVIPDEDRTNVRSIENVLILDSRDDLINTTNGSYFEITNDYAGRFLGGTNDFFRVEVTAKTFYSIGRHRTLSSRIILGYMDSPGGLNDIPLNERFYTGGPNSVRGFNYRYVGSIDDNGIPSGGRVKLVWNVIEYRRSVYKWIGASFFIDTGGIWSAAYHVNAKDIRIAPGFGVRANTPLGLVRIDFGTNPFYKSDESRAQVFFSVGQSF